MAEQAVSTASPAEISLGQKLEQLEAALNEAHGLCDSMQPSDSAQEGTPSVEGAHGTADRCQEKAQALINRLNRIGNRVGLL